MRHLLITEDNEGDILLMREALENSAIRARISVVKDGKEAIDFLTNEGAYADADLPDMMILDINLPKKNGHEVLQFVKENQHLKHIPVIMLTTSSFQKDIDLSYQNNANCYIIKPDEVETFLETIIKIADFWMSLVQLPLKPKLK